MNFRTRFSERVAVQLVCPPEEGRTKSEFMDECDINKIMARYRRTGVLPESARAAAARFGDFSQVPSFMEMQDKILAANEMFAALPAAVRKQFDNDPHEFLSAAQTEEGQELLIKLGLGQEELASPKGGVPSPAAGVAAKEVVEPPKGGAESPKAESKPTKEGK